MQLRDMPEFEPRSELMAKIALSMFEGRKRLFLLLFTTPQSDPNARMATVGADMHLGDLHRQQTRIVGFEAYNLAEFFAQGFGDAECATFIHKE